MKKLNKKLLFLAIVFSIAITTSCGKDKEESNKGQTTSPKVSTPIVEKTVADFSSGRLDYKSFQNFFQLDYNTQSPDNPAASGKVTDSTKKAAGKSDSVIPGLRKLSDYITKYTENRADIKLPSIKSADKSKDGKKKSASKKADFVIEDWGPQTEIVAADQGTSFYVVFSKPVKALTALGEPSGTSDVMTIEPAIDGVFRWYGTQHLSFEASKIADPSVTYKISIDNKLKAEDGSKITGETVFYTKAADININQIFAGFIGMTEWGGEYEYDENRGVVPPNDRKVLIRLNYALPENRIHEIITVKSSTGQLAYDSEGLYTDKYLFNWGENKTIYSEEDKRTNTYVLTLKEQPPANDTVRVVANVNNRESTAYYKTMQPLKITEFENMTAYSNGTKANPVTIRFLHPIDIKSAAQTITYDGGKSISEDKFTVNGSTLNISNIFFGYNEKHTIEIAPGLKDIYGQILSLKKSTQYTVTTMPASSYVKFLDDGINIMEAAYPHKYLFEYQNTEDDSWYSIDKTDTPLDTKFNAMQQDKKVIKPAKKDTRYFEEIDLDPLLTNGKGSVKFNSLVYYKHYNYWKEEWQISPEQNCTSIQVTDLGVTARLGLNRGAVLVTSLSTGKPVKGAQVYVVDNYPYLSADELIEKWRYGGNETDEKGLAVFDFDENAVNVYEDKVQNDYNLKNRIIIVKTGDDQVMFQPTSHNSWRSGVSTGQAYGVRSPKQRTFMFVDRGLYKPGETVTFRGIDRDQVMGRIETHKGSYRVSARRDQWQSDNIIPEISGELSESGGFYGSFTLPDDLEPGYYRLEYKRGNENNPAYITFNVAEFERLKIQGEVKVPEITYYGGDKISATISASYLAGGKLGGAAYDATWYRQPVDFAPDTVETKGFNFGPYNAYGSRDYFSQEKGVLSADGEANLLCNSTKIADGRPNSYRLAAAITDISDQRISVENSILVHPALFYIGVKKPAEIAGFAKKGQKLNFPYILTDVKGNLDSSAARSLEYKLTREEWTISHEQSVYNSVYERYTREDVLDASGNVSIKADGKLEVTPSRAGWYTLEISGTDKNGDKAITEYEFYVTGGDYYWHNTYDSQSIDLTPDQTLYNPGDTAKILLQSPLPQGDYLITVEREGIFTQEVRHLDTSADVLDVKIAGNYVPVVYVSVSSYSVRSGEPTNEYGEVDMDKPKGYYGVTPLMVNPYVRSFSVEIEADKPSYQPGEEVTLTLKATKGGKAFAGAELTVMAVDRGVLDLINYHVPNPIDFFYDKYNFPLCVTGGDSRAYLMDPVTYNVKNLAGGDASEDEEKEEDARKDFRPTACFEPVLVTGKDGTVKCTFKMPDTLTTYRITAFGVSEDLFALQESEARVQNPINVQQVQPRRLRTRDTAECGVLLTNLSDKTQTVTVSMEARSPAGNTAEDELYGRVTKPGKAVVDGKAEQTVKVISGDSTVVYFDVAALEEGTVELVYRIKSEILNESLISAIKIEETYVYETVSMTGTIDDENKKDRVTEYIAIPDFSKNGKGSLNLTLDATRLGPLASAVNYVFDYPYGCLEQQSSKMLPLIIFNEYIDVFDLNSKVTDIKKCVKAYTKDWAKYQKQDGGFGYWSNSNLSSIYPSLKIGEVCGLALKRGYSKKELNIDIEGLRQYIWNENNSSRDYISAFKAYSAYVLALLGDDNAEILLNQIYGKMADCNLTTMAYAGLGYLELGTDVGKRKAGELAAEIRKYLTPAQRSVTILPKTGDYFDLWFNSEIGQNALILELFSKLNVDDSMVDRLIFTLLEKKSVRGYWQNTSDTAVTLRAVYAYIKARNLDETNYKAEASLNGESLMKGKFEGVTAKPVTLQLPFDQQPLASVGRNEELPLEFSKNGNGNLYYTVEMKYALSDELHKARDEGLGIKYTIKDYDTDAAVNADSDSPVVVLEAGKLYKATIELVSPRDRTYVALRAPIPSGAEILDSTFVTSGDDAEIETSSSGRWWRQWLSNKVIYDNEIQFFYDDFGSGAATVTFTFRASRRGVYPTPPVQAECMYEPEIFGRGDGYLFEIK